MLDTFEIRTYSDGWHYDADADEDVQDYAVAFTTRGRVKVGGGLAAREADAGGRTVTTVTRELHVPVNSPAIPVGAVAVCTQVAPTSDPTLLGATLRLAGPVPGSQTTARRLEVSEVIS